MEVIRAAPVEVGYLFAPDGRQIAWYVGDEREIRGFTAADLRALSGGAFVHNHPPYARFAEGDPRRRAGSFSPLDLAFAWEHDLAEMVAVTAERTYRLRPRGGGYYLDPGELFREYAKAATAVEERLHAEAKAGIIGSEEADAEGRIADRVMHELERYFDYRVEGR